MFLLRESKRKGLEFLGMGDRRKELSVWFVVCVCVRACVRMDEWGGDEGSCERK